MWAYARSVTKWPVKDRYAHDNAHIPLRDYFFLALPHSYFS